MRLRKRKEKTKEIYATLRPIDVCNTPMSPWNPLTFCIVAIVNNQLYFGGGLHTFENGNAPQSDQRQMNLPSFWFLLIHLRIRTLLDRPQRQFSRQWPYFGGQVSLSRRTWIAVGKHRRILD